MKRVRSNVVSNVVTHPSSAVWNRVEWNPWMGLRRPVVFWALRRIASVSIYEQARKDYDGSIRSLAVGD